MSETPCRGVEGTGGRSRPDRHALTRSALPAALGLAFGLIYTYGATSYHIGTPGSPGPGTFPLAVGLLMVVTSAWCLVAEYWRPSAPPEGLGANAWRVPVISVGLVTYMLLLKPAGFLLAAAALCAVLLLTLGRRPWWVAVGSALVAGGAAYYLFGALGVPLPMGVMPF